MRISLSTLILLIILLAEKGFSQDTIVVQSKKEEFKTSVKDDSLFSLKSSTGIVPFFIHTMGEQVKAPFHMNGKQILHTAVVLAATGILIHFDQDIDKLFRPLKSNNPFLNKWSPEFTQLGDYYGYGIVAGIFGVSAITKNYKPFHTSILAAQSAFSAGIWVRVGKMLSGRMRPGATYSDREFNSDHWFGPFAQFDSNLNRGRSSGAFDAFPSGHTAVAFALATSFAKQYSNHKAIPVILYSLAGMIGISRMVEHEHWASDILPSAFIGYLCADQVYRYDKKLKEKKKTAMWRLYPNYNQSVGFTLIISPQ